MTSAAVAALSLATLALACAADGVVPADRIAVPAGFRAELVYEVPREGQGSWVSLAADPKGRLIAGDQNGALYRITPAPVGGDPAMTRVQRLDVAVGCAQGLLWAHDSLYVDVSGEYRGNGSGIYRLQDTDGDDAFDRVTRLRAIDGKGEHGPHGLALGPDGMIYVTAGNFTKLPQDFTASLPARHWAEDILLPRHWDPNGHAKGLQAPGGWIARLDADGKRWELVSIGYRNAYDLAFAPDGELFTWDSDMEWDMGLPWYRPIRAVHVTPGSDFGWRSGSGNAPAWFADSLPPLQDVGPGSPVGVCFGTGAAFPARYQRALFLLDWTFGTVWALRLEPNGATYTAVREQFATAKPWPLTDVVIARDGAMYLTVGGRGTRSGIYRITYTGPESTAPAPPPAPPTSETQVRRRLESRILGEDAGAVDEAWPQLGHPDRFIRAAARAVIEHRPVGLWSERVFAERDPQARITALVALARCGTPDLQARAFDLWLGLGLESLGVEARLEALRAASLLITRFGPPAPELTTRIIARLDPWLSSGDERVNRGVAGLLAVLGSPTLAGKLVKCLGEEEPPRHDPGLEALLERNGGYGGAIAAMLRTPPVVQRLAYADALSVLDAGWTPALRREYIDWLDRVLREGRGGNSFIGFVRAIRAAAVARAPDVERAALSPIGAMAAATSPPAPRPKGPGRPWTVDEATALAVRGLHRRDAANGKAMLHAVQCLSCHRFGGEGGAVGPDLSAVGGKFGPHDLIEAIIEPSKTISDQYQSTTVSLTSGGTVVGRILGEEDGSLLVATNPFDPQHPTRIAKRDVAGTKPFPVSPMPPGLVNGLNPDELLDLIAYLLAAGDPQDAAFR